LSAISPPSMLSLGRRNLNSLLRGRRGLGDSGCSGTLASPWCRGVGGAGEVGAAMTAGEGDGDVGATAAEDRGIASLRLLSVGSRGEAAGAGEGEASLGEDDLDCRGDAVVTGNEAGASEKRGLTILRLRSTCGKAAGGGCGGSIRATLRFVLAGSFASVSGFRLAVLLTSFLR